MSASQRRSAEWCRRECNKNVTSHVMFTLYWDPSAALDKPDHLTSLLRARVALLANCLSGETVRRTTIHSRDSRCYFAVYGRGSVTTRRAPEVNGLKVQGITKVLLRL